MKRRKQTQTAIFLAATAALLCSAWPQARAQSAARMNAGATPSPAYATPRHWPNALSDREKYLLRALGELEAERGSPIVPDRESLIEVMEKISARQDEAEWVWRQLQRYENFDALLVRAELRLAARASRLRNVADL